MQKDSIGCYNISGNEKKIRKDFKSKQEYL